MSRSLFAELRRRNVFRAAILYVGAVWAFGQGLSQFSPALGLPDWATRWFLVAAVIGFPFWIAFAWFFEFTPEGLKLERDIPPEDSITRHTGRKIDFAIIGVLAVAVVLLLTDRFVLRHGVNQEADIAISEKSIAVLPFVDMSQAKDQEYFSDGISEELLNLLAKITQLHVAARTSSFSFKGKDVPIPEIAKTLHVANVLEGSIRKAGDQVRITAQLIRAADGYHVWSETWDRKLDDIFKIQDEIAGKVVEELKVTLLGAAPKVLTTDPQSYALYLQARELAGQKTAEAYAKSDALYRQALAIDPRYAPAWDHLARNFSDEAGIGVLSNQEGFTRAREAEEKALAIDSDYAPALAQLGYIADAQNDLVGAAKYYEHALAVDPTNLGVLNNTAVFLQDVGRLDEALALYEAVVRRDPVNANAIANLGNGQRLAGRYDASIASDRTVLSLSPARGVVRTLLGIALLSKGDPSAALAEVQQETSEVWRMIGLPLAYHALGRKAESDKALAALIAKYEKDWPYNVAYVYAFRGEADEAFAWLEKAIEYQDPGISEIVTENLFDKLHADPRWLPFLRKIGRDPETLAKIQLKVTLPKAWQAVATAVIAR
jgi:TolB-like protein/tetratricopeptide (TPR) repeat protein